MTFYKDYNFLYCEFQDNKITKMTYRTKTLYGLIPHDSGNGYYELKTQTQYPMAVAIIRHVKDASFEILSGHDRLVIYQQLME